MRLVVFALLAAQERAGGRLCSTVGNGVRAYWADRATQTTDVEELAAIHEATVTGVEKFERHCNGTPT